MAMSRRRTRARHIRALGDPQPIPIAWQLSGKRALMDHPQLIAAQELSSAATPATSAPWPDSFVACATGV
ncbi:hypothetical protein [Nonomuraea insulae]|uniref:Uncharacterized protein n=1 Tax=Nonomuraea insulae TaxID=1616787 RepID=A0ABW1CP99_9ACTN